jgi:hypothetical protein
MLIEDYNTNKMVNRTNQIYNNMVNKLKQREEDIENELQVKSRLIEINNEAVREKNSKIMTITGSFIAFSVGVFAWVGFLGGMISKNTLFKLLFFGICLFFVMALLLNKYIIKEFKELSDETKEKIQKDGDWVNLKALQWVDDNCDCPQK